jgi:hypothetical protein
VKSKNDPDSAQARLVVAFLMWSATAQAQEAVPVTVDNVVRAESDRYFARFLQEGGGQLGKFHMIAISRRSIINRLFATTETFSCRRRCSIWMPVQHDHPA